MQSHARTASIMDGFASFELVRSAGRDWTESISQSKARNPRLDAFRVFWRGEVFLVVD